MKIKHRFVFCSDEKASIRFLDKQKVKYDKGEILSVFEMFEDGDNFKLISDFMVSHNALNTSEAIYTLEEIENAKWLSVRSRWMSHYPQPQDILVTKKFYSVVKEAKLDRGLVFEPVVLV